MVEYTSVRENSTSIFKNPKEFMETWKNVSLRPTMKEKGGIYTVYHFVDFNNLRAEISSKKRGQQKKSTLK